MQIAQWLHFARQQLSNCSPSAQIDAEVLLEAVLDRTISYFRMWPQQLLTKAELAQANSYLAQRQQGKPIAYITGFRAFWDLNLACNSSTLIPRADTECLIEYVFEQYAQQPTLTLLDLGTGTGAIALTIKNEQPNWQVLAMDYSFAACQLSQQNNQQLIHGITIFNGSWLDAVQSQSLDIIISNPPYIEQQDQHLNQGDVRFEPKSALTAGFDGLDDIKTICQQASYCLKNGGELIIEHGYQQKQAVQAIFKKANFIDIQTHQDYGRNDRFTVGQKKPA